MSGRSMRYRVELAGEADDAELRRVLAATAMPGRISLAFEREPSFFAAAAVEGSFHQVIVARASDGAIVGLGSRSVGERYVNGRPMPVGYLSQLRVLPEHRSRGLIARGYRLLRSLHEDGRTQFYLTTIAEGNALAESLLTSGRAGLPAYHPLGRYHTAAIGLRPWRRRRPRSISGITIRPAEAGELGRVIAFVQHMGSGRQFLPRYRQEDFTEAGRLHGLRPADILLAERGNSLAGTLAGWDQSVFRQERIASYGGALRWLRPVYNLSARLRGRPGLPPAGARLRRLMAALPVARDDDSEIFTGLMESLLIARAAGPWDYLLVGMHDSDPLLPALKLFAAQWFITRPYVVCFADGEALRQSLQSAGQRPVYLELGSL